MKNINISGKQIDQTKPNQKLSFFGEFPRQKSSDPLDLVISDLNKRLNDWANGKTEINK